MILLPAHLRASLHANAVARAVALMSNEREPDPVPTVKFFNPLGAATWLATEIDADGDTLFGLADLGFGFPELGSFSLSEIAAVRLPFGLAIERDLDFASDLPLSVWADSARREGSIIHAEAALRKRRAVSATPLPPPEPGDG